MKKRRILVLCVLSAILTGAVQLTASASTETKITSVSLQIDSDITAGDSDSDVEVTSSSSRYDVDDVEVTNEPDDEWEEDDKPRLKITLTAEDGYYFASGSVTKSDVSLSGDDGTVTSVSRSDSDTLLVYVTLDALEDDGDYELEVYGLEWDESDATAYWDDSEDANYYEVRLYRGSSTVTSVLTTYGTSYDFSSYFTQSGTYSFRVRAVYNSSNKGSWEESDDWYVTSSEASEIYAGSSSYGAGPGTSDSSGGAWLKDDVGWWYCNADKSYTVNNWQFINGFWYYFDERGYMKTGWILWNGSWYYCTESGEMLTNTVTPDGYYVGSDGAWIS